MEKNTPDDEFKISEERLIELFKSSQKDPEYQEALLNSGLGSNLKDEEIIDFIRRVSKIRKSLDLDENERLGSLMGDFRESMSTILYLHEKATVNIAALSEVFISQNQTIKAMQKQVVRLNVILFVVALFTIGLTSLIASLIIAISK